MTNEEIAESLSNLRLSQKRRIDDILQTEEGAFAVPAMLAEIAKQLVDLNGNISDLREAVRDLSDQ